MADRLALIIANGNFDDPKLSRLSTPIRDAEALAEVLRNPDIGNFDVTLLIDESESEIRRAIGRFYARRKRDDLLLLYYSGHGIRDAHGDLYLATKDTDMDIAGASSLDAGFVRDQIDKSQSRRNVVVLDCCHSGAFGKAKSALGESVGTKDAFEGSGHGRVILTASDALELSWEGGTWLGDQTMSVFTHFLVQGLRTGEADTNRDGGVSIDEIYEYARDNMIRSGHTKQTPLKFLEVKGKSLYLAKTDRGPVSKPDDLLQTFEEDLRRAIESHRMGLRVGAVIELKRLLHSSNPTQIRAAYGTLDYLTHDDSKRVSSAAEKALGLYDDAHLPPDPSSISREDDADDERVVMEATGDDRDEAPQPAESDDSTMLPDREVDTSVPPSVETPEPVPVSTWPPDAASAAAAALPKEVQEDVESDRADYREAAVGDLDHLMRGSHLGMARTAFAKLRELRQDDSPRVSEKAAKVLDAYNAPPADAAIGDTWIRPADGAVMVYVPAGEFLMGSTDAHVQQVIDACVSGGSIREKCERLYADELEQHTVTSDAFWIDKYEVTNAQFAAFLNAMGNQEAGGVTWLEADSEDVHVAQTGDEWQADGDYAEHPVVEVSWHGAQAYAQWVGGRLPTEAEWEKAARGTEGRIYPWGNDWSSEEVLCNVGDQSRGTTPVGAYASQSDSSYGCSDMAGNVLEWTRSLYQDYPYDPEDGRDDPETEGRRVVRGGAFIAGPSLVRCASREGVRPDSRYNHLGFRVVMPSSPGEV